MHYETELQFLTDTFQKHGIAVKMANMDRPLSSDILLGQRFLELNTHADTPLRDLLHKVEQNTVYTIEYGLCSFTYFLLPQLHPDVLLIIGPYVTQQLTTQEILELAEQYQIDPKHHKYLYQFHTSIPFFPKSSHLHLMLDTFFDRLWGKGNYSSETVQQEFAGGKSFWPDLQLSEEDNVLLNAAIMEERYRHENELIQAVRSGQLRRVESFLSRMSPNAFEQRLSNPLRNVKNYCIITNTLLRKAAEQGGVHPVHINTVSSGFAYKIEQLSTTAEGTSLIAEMAQSYCQLVRHHATKGYSPPIQKAIILIDSNLGGDLSLSRLAKELNINSSYLSTLFKKETGQTFTAYINHQRIQHAAHLLRTTNLQVQTVAQHCGIMDFHYFCRVFKNSVGKTPTEYRSSYGFD